jgi:hypothetical protein
VTLNVGRGTDRKYAPYAFTEQGVAMLSSVLRSPKAIVEWLALHRPELLENWQRARAQEPLQKIAPLD